MKQGRRYVKILTTIWETQGEVIRKTMTMNSQDYAQTKSSGNLKLNNI